MDSGTRPFDVAGVSALATAICYMSMVTFIGRLTRSLAGQCPARLRPYVFDLVTTFQLMAYSLELGHIRGFAGDVGFTIALVCIPFWAELTITQGRYVTNSLIYVFLGFFSDWRTYRNRKTTVFMECIFKFH